ncbi:ABC transporter substrate-binding protein [Bradyrhizobium yuanmingense]|uniref:ABC transport system substrate-binding protein n=2 Tax=Bradyrhizobium yuanmingense TaxID=108015 RepID=A0ABV4GHP4_9BRAD|nr:ABC transporter substrate-binding protein [Bradyrhizobium yuanmingense]TGN84434.1 ABC transporter substrate-binding protein [Bradyrhizobium yuanmingense]
MRRRAFIGLMMGAIGWPLIARTQQSSATPRVVHLGPVEIPAQIAATKRLLAELGHVEGRIRLEFRHAAGDADALPALAQEIVRDGRVDVIIAISTPAALAAYKATRTIPIVTLAAVDPVASGLADSLARPGRNVTGIAVFSEETTAKRIELMREILPRAVHLGTVTTKVSSGAQSLTPVLEAGRKLGFQVEAINIDDPASIGTLLSPDNLARFDGLVFVPDVVLSGHQAEVVRLVNLSRKPAIFASPDWVANGAFMSFGPDFADAGRRLIAQVDRVLRGAKPGDLPFERPTKFDLRINLRIAKALGLDLPATVIARADEVIE